MLVALAFTYRASRKEPLAEVLERIHAAFRHWVSFRRMSHGQHGQPRTTLTTRNPINVPPG
jgi:hypothetical protein